MMIGNGQNAPTGDDGMTALAARLLEAYPGPRRTVTPTAVVISIDDRSEVDIHPGFCTITATVRRDSDSITLALTHPPLDGDVRALVDDLGGRVTETKLATVLSVDLSPTDHRRVRDLARLVKAVVGRGRRYADPNWKWIAPRTAGALERFARHLAAHQAARPRTRNKEG
jgi:hypothetical protein